VEVGVDGRARLLERDVSLHAGGADPALARRERALEPSVAPTVLSEIDGAATVACRNYDPDSV